MKKNTTCEKDYKSTEVIKRLCLSKGRRPFYILLLTLFAILNMLFIPTLFTARTGLFDENDVCAIFILFALVGILILLVIMPPFYLKKRNVEEGASEPKASAWLKILSLWISECVYVIAQMLVFVVCSVLSPVFDLAFIVALLVAIAVCLLLFIWTIICAGLYLVARSTQWYFIGFFTLSIAPIVISQGCYEIYNLSPLLLYAEWNPLNFNIFAVVIALFGYPVALLLALAIIGVLVYICHRVKIHRKINRSALLVAYKMILIFLISLSGGFLVAKKFIGDYQISLQYILAFLMTVFVVATGLVCLNFRKEKLLVRGGIIFVALAVSSALVLGVIPAKAQKEAYILPDIEDIESVELFLDSIEEFEVDKYFEDCIELHKILLELFEDGYLPDKTEQPYTEPECIADMWEDINFRYKLKNGKGFSREYRDLKDPAFDEFYIELLQSDMYAYSLQKTEMNNPRMQIFGKWCELPESCIEELLKTYCDELKKADKSAFYEGYGTIRLTDVYDYRDRIIYIPLSFTKTRELAESYINLYREW